MMADVEAHQPLPRNTASILNRQGKVVLNYSKVFICDNGAELVIVPNACTWDEIRAAGLKTRALKISWYSHD